MVNKQTGVWLYVYLLALYHLGQFLALLLCVSEIFGTLALLIYNTM